MFYERYRGVFCSRTDEMWRVSILLETDAPNSEIGELRFPADEPLVIEWEEQSKEQPVVSSVATLTLLSPGDRTYENLYTIAVGKIRMDVYRDGLLYWSGVIDPEFYEEPYATVSDYEVTLTFSDFGLLDRLKYDMSGMKTLREVVQYSLGCCAINYGALDERFISTALTSGGAAMSLSDLKVRSDNFYDEDGESLSLRKVLEGIFQPLALRIEQRFGKIWVYDLNGLYGKARRLPLRWSSDDQMMGVDAVYNNAKITWSPYAQSGTLSDGECWTEETDSNLMALNIISGRTKGLSTYYSYHYSTDLNDWFDATDSGFTLWTSSVGKGLDYLADGARYFKIVPQYDGSDCEGVALFWTSVRGYRQSSGSGWTANMEGKSYGFNPAYLKTTADTAGQKIFQTQPIWLPPVDKASGLYVRIALEMLMDPRFNPFESAVNWMKYIEQKDWASQWSKRGNFVFVPVTVKFRPSGSSKVYCWTNRTIVGQSVSSPVRTLSGTLGRWVEYDMAADDDPSEWGYFAYYNPSDRAEQAGVGGWQKNRPAINPHTKSLVSILEHAEDGQYLPYPDFDGCGGDLWLELRRRNWEIADGDYSKKGDSYGLWGKFCWLLMKLPEVEIVNSTQFEQTISTEDVEYKAELNSHAKDPIELETICGTAADGVPTARGAYFNAATGKQITNLTRAGRTTQAEELLIGTLYSQFADRHTKLTGTIDLVETNVLPIYTEAMQEGKCFLMTGAVEDIQDGTNEASLVELRPDEYDKEV